MQSQSCSCAAKITISPPEHSTDISSEVTSQETMAMQKRNDQRIYSIDLITESKAHVSAVPHGRKKLLPIPLAPVDTCENRFWYLRRESRESPCLSQSLEHSQ